MVNTKKFVITLWVYDRIVNQWTVYGQDRAEEWFYRFRVWPELGERVTLESCN